MSALAFVPIRGFVAIRDDGSREWVDRFLYETERDCTLFLNTPSSRPEPPSTVHEVVAIPTALYDAMQRVKVAKKAYAQRWSVGTETELRESIDALCTLMGEG